MNIPHITGLIAANGYYEKKPTAFFTINPDVYWARRNVIDVKVIADHAVAAGTAVVGQATWTLR